MEVGMEAKGIGWKGVETPKIQKLYNVHPQKTNFGYNHTEP